ncbi:hypothetical protein M752DRAFT_68535 [Aspergillus phoenicis ATCC 13157]|uniref:Uncharacterized protein n=1 Tax=Aspergillus phoenicis ATCC 13157 TaxID=1353007 RepID=A0A370PXW0_ASPPH|nr:hypothetical protein M752DRAFT_68535 [Aspergillus phoenicis ATCC 13157]
MVTSDQSFPRKPVNHEAVAGATATSTVHWRGRLARTGSYPGVLFLCFRAKNHRDFVVASAGVGVCPGIALVGYPIRRSLPTYLDETAMMISTRHVQQQYIHSIRRE